MASAFQVATDDLLLQKARKGDLEAMEALYRTYAAPVYGLARRFCARPQDAEEVAQETFLEVFKSLGRFRGDAPLWAWVRRITASKALMRIRQADGVREESLGHRDEGGDDVAGSDPGPSASIESEKVALEKALARLAPLARAVVWLHDVEGYTHDEIAELCGKTPSFSKSQLARAHERLRSLLTRETEGLACTQT